MHNKNEISGRFICKLSDVVLIITYYFKIFINIMKRVVLSIDGNNIMLIITIHEKVGQKIYI